MLKEAVINGLRRIPYFDNKYIFSLFIIVGAVVLAKILLFVFEKYLEKIAKKTETEVDDLIFERTRRPLFYLILTYGLKLALLNLAVDGWLTRIMSSLMALVFIFVLVRAADVVIEVWGRAFAQKTKSQIDDVLMPLFHKAAKVIAVIIALMWVLDIWGVDITPYLAGVGVSGLVLGFALQDSLKNIFGGVTLLLDKTFRVGDKIKLESGEIGEVLDIGLRSTKLRTYDNELIYVPNGYLANSRVHNFTRPNPKVRVGVDFGVEYGTEVKRVREVVLRAVKEMEGILEEPALEIQFLEMGDFALKFRAYFWVANWKEAHGKKLEATERIYDALTKAKIGIPFPTRTVYMKKEG